MMKRYVLTITSIALLTSFSLAGCGKKEQPSAVIIPSPEEAIEPTEAAEPKPTSRQSSEQSSGREIYQQQVTSELQKLNSQIDRLQIQARQSEALAQEKLSKRIKELTKKMQLRSQLNAELEHDMAELMQQLQQQSQPDVKLNDLIQKQALVQQKMEALQVADEQTWEQSKFDVDETLATLKQSYERFQPKPIATESVESVPNKSNSSEFESVESVPDESNSSEPDSMSEKSQ